MIYTVIWFKYFYLIQIIFKNRSVSSIDGTITGTITPGHSRPGSNGNEKLLVFRD